MSGDVGCSIFDGFAVLFGVGFVGDVFTFTEPLSNSLTFATGLLPSSRNIIQVPSSTNSNAPIPLADKNNGFRQVAFLPPIAVLCLFPPRRVRSSTAELNVSSRGANCEAGKLRIN